MLTRFRFGFGLLSGAIVAAVSVVPVSATPAAGCTTYYDALGLPHVVCANSDTQPGTTSPPTTPVSTGGSGGSTGNGGDDSGQQTGFVTYDQVRCVSAPIARATADLGAVQGTRTATSVTMWCESGVDGGPGFYFWSTPAAPPPVDLVALSRQARADITIPQFRLEFGPDPKRLAVNMQTAFAAVPDRSMTLSASASDQGITVTVNGRLLGMEWSPGEPVQCTAGNTKTACSGGQVGSVDCSGTACQYTYLWMSSPARTGGAPVWTVTAVSTWQFTYTTTGTGPTTGAATATWTEPMPVGTATVSIGEWSTAGGFQG